MPADINLKIFIVIQYSAEDEGYVITTAEKLRKKYLLLYGMGLNILVNTCIPR